MLISFSLSSLMLIECLNALNSHQELEDEVLEYETREGAVSVVSSRVDELSLIGKLLIIINLCANCHKQLNYLYYSNSLCLYLLLSLLLLL